MAHKRATISHQTFHRIVCWIFFFWWFFVQEFIRFLISICCSILCTNLIGPMNNVIFCYMQTIIFPALKPFLAFIFYQIGSLYFIFLIRAQNVLTHKRHLLRKMCHEHCNCIHIHTHTHKCTPRKLVGNNTVQSVCTHLTKRIDWIIKTQNVSIKMCKWNYCFFISMYPNS